MFVSDGIVLASHARGGKGLELLFFHTFHYTLRMFRRLVVVRGGKVQHGQARHQSVTAYSIHFQPALLFAALDVTL